MKDKNSTVGSKLRNDLIFIAVLLLISAVGFLCLLVFRGKGDVVRVTVNGEVYKVYSLSENITEDILSGENGEQFNRLVIQDGQAYIQSASCPDGICVDHRPISKSGESIICLPNKVVVTAIADEKNYSPDIVS